MRDLQLQQIQLLDLRGEPNKPPGLRLQAGVLRGPCHRLHGLRVVLFDLLRAIVLVMLHVPIRVLLRGRQLRFLLPRRVLRGFIDCFLRVMRHFLLHVHG